MRSKLSKLDAIRGIASLYVVLGHTLLSDNFQFLDSNFSVLFKFGQEAVIVFFLMSGFVIGYSFENTKDKSFSTYFSKRFFRIYIPLLIVFATDYLIRCLLISKVIYPEWLQLLGNLFMLQDAGYLKPNVIVEPYLGNYPLWSLSYEWWFYMLFYLLYRIFNNISHLNIFVFTLVICSGVSYIIYPFFLNRLFMYYGIWWTGVIMAYSYARYTRVNMLDMKWPFLTILLIIMILFMNVLVHKETVSTIGMSPLLELRHFVFAIFTLIIALVWQRFGWVLFDTTVGRFKFIAPFSYVLYISHYFLISNAKYLKYIGNQYLELSLYFLIVVIYSYIIELKVYPVIKALTRSSFKVKNCFKVAS